MQRPLPSPIETLDSASISSLNTLENASEILNQVCQENQVSYQSSPSKLLALAENGLINLTVILPKDFGIKQKNYQSINQDIPPPLRSIPKELDYFFAGRHAIYQLTIGQTARLTSVFSLSGEGEKTTYDAMAPYVEISISDLRISGEQVFRLIALIRSSKVVEQSDARETYLAENGPEEPATEADEPKAKNKWDRYARKRLLDEYNAGGITHQTLADKHCVTRQRMSALLKKAREEWTPKKASAFSPLSWQPKK